MWLVMAGRGFGKTRIGAEWVIERQATGKYRRFALVGETAADTRDVMIEGESGILTIAPPWNRPIYEPSKRRLTWPNGAIATTYSGEKPDQLRGPQHDAAWADEVAKWRYAQDAWDNLEFGLRLGPDPRVVGTTTPRPIKLIRDLLADSLTAVTTGSSYENAANLAPSFIQRIIGKYEGTRLGRQELYAEMLEDTPGALWRRDMLESGRAVKHPDLVRIVVGVDPSVSDNEESAETGIIAAGLGTDGHGYILDDVSLHGSPDTWARSAVTAYWKFHADRLVGEVNNGGDMVEHTIRTVDKTVAYKAVHASRGKLTRAEPIAALYEQGKIHHVGMFATLEDQLCTWTPGQKSPDRMDALVWALTELMLGQSGVSAPPQSIGTGASKWRSV